MPRVEINPQQQDALNQIEENLKMLENIRGILSRGAGKGLVVSAGDPRKSGARVAVPDKMVPRIEAVLKQLRREAIRGSNGLAQRFGISFSAQEQALLDDEFEDYPDPAGEEELPEIEEEAEETDIEEADTAPDAEDVDDSDYPI